MHRENTVHSSAAEYSAMSRHWSAGKLHCVGTPSYSKQQPATRKGSLAQSFALCSLFPKLTWYVNARRNEEHCPTTGHRSTDSVDSIIHFASICLLAHFSDNTIQNFTNSAQSTLRIPRLASQLAKDRRLLFLRRNTFI